MRREISDAGCGGDGEEQTSGAGGGMQKKGVLSVCLSISLCLSFYLPIFLSVYHPRAHPCTSSTPAGPGGESGEGWGFVL